MAGSLSDVGCLIREIHTQNFHGKIKFGPIYKPRPLGPGQSAEALPSVRLNVTQWKCCPHNE